MRRSQWFVFAIMFLLASMFYWYQAKSSFSFYEELTTQKTEMREIITEENFNFTEKTGMVYLVQQNNANRVFLESRINYAFAISYSFFSLACLICGFIEPRQKKGREK
ncbi:MAG: hypothetical protein NTW67_06820 [Candidatus Woesearchaeota archaeon]|nr:hypothetical protein [Candidatus Woesearchaeota archaeon]